MQSSIENLARFYEGTRSMVKKLFGHTSTSLPLDAV
jgi:hypothetical protein